MANGLRARNQALVDERQQARFSRLKMLLQLRWGLYVWPALRRWQHHASLQSMRQQGHISALLAAGSDADGGSAAAATALDGGGVGGNPGASPPSHTGWQPSTPGRRRGGGGAGPATPRRAGVPAGMMASAASARQLAHLTPAEQVADSPDLRSARRSSPLRSTDLACGLRSRWRRCSERCSCATHSWPRRSSRRPPRASCAPSCSCSSSRCRHPPLLVTSADEAATPTFAYRPSSLTPRRGRRAPRRRRRWAR